MNFIGCDGELVEAKAGPANVNGVLACTTPWTVVTEQELLSQVSQHNLLSREDFNILSAWILAILIAAMGLRIVLKTLNIGARQHEKN